MKHDVETALEVTGLTEEEAFFILRFAGRLGYGRAINRMRNPLKVLRHWLIWIGGWETTELSQWDRGKSAWEIISNVGPKRYISSPFPVSLFGHRITLFGKWAQMKWRGGYLCLSNSYAYEWPDKLYWSPNGTPHHPNTRFYWRRRKAAIQ